MSIAIDPDDDLAAAVHKTAGYVSMCWDDTAAAGEFQPDAALAACTELIQHIERHYVRRAVVVDMVGDEIQPGLDGLVTLTNRA